jgi:hypothetical protein
MELIIVLFFFDDEKREDKRENIEKLKPEIENNNIIILCVDMGYMPREYSKRLRTNKFYDYANVHFNIVKGYIIVNNRICFEIYDPNNLGESYSDGTPKGKDRYYDATSLSEAITNWSDYGLVINEHINYNITD